jgi:BirA family biotin operon repressor/biotin-[acetyl-CoA-carboxylase] ligase
VKHIVLGIGLDVNQTQADFPPELRKIASSLRIESRQTVHRTELATNILHALDHDYARIGAGEFEAIADEWESLCSTLGHHVAIRVGDRTVRGRAESLDGDGALLLRTQHGRLERIIGGYVTLE